MPRRITTGVQGGPILGKFTSEDNSLLSIEPNADIIFDPNGTGLVKTESHLQLNANNTLRLADSDSSNYVALAAPATVSTNITYTFPATATANYFLRTDANGTLSWAEANVQISNTTSATSTYYPALTTSTSGVITELTTSNSKLSFVPSTGVLSATTFSGAFSGNLSGNVTSTGTSTFTTVDINGGNIDGTTIGSANAAAGTFTSITETSSIVYKENVTPIENALDAILQLVGVTYDRKDGSSKDEAGLIAEDTAKILPNLVTYKNGKPEGINYTKLTAYLIESVKTLKKELDSLRG